MSEYVLSAYLWILTYKYRYKPTELVDINKLSPIGGQEESKHHSEWIPYYLIDYRNNEQVYIHSKLMSYC